MYRTLIIILFLLAGVKLLSSEHCVNYSFTQLSIEQGLSQSTAQSILLDHKGTLWIGTKSGLNSYTQEGIRLTFITREILILFRVTILII